MARTRGTWWVWTSGLLLSLAMPACRLTAQSLSATLDFQRFRLERDQALIELWLGVEGSSLQYNPVAPPDQGWQGAVHYTWMIRREDSVFFAEKVRLVSPVFPTVTGTTQWLSGRQRVALPYGTYTLEVETRDENRPDAPPLHTNIPLEVSFPEAQPAFSDLQLLEDYRPATSETPHARHGWLLQPYPGNFFPPTQQQLRFFTEFYNSAAHLGDGAPYVLNYQLLTAETRQPLAAYGGFSRRQATANDVLLAQLDIQTLPSGNYIVQVMARNAAGEILATQEKFFQRSNPSAMVAQVSTANGLLDLHGTFAEHLTDDHLTWVLPALQPLATADEVETLRTVAEQGTLAQKRDYLYRFWHERHPFSAQEAYHDYVERLQIAEKLYTSPNLRAYQTDRGRVYLQYGKPNFIENELTYRQRNAIANSSMIPFEVWHYPHVIPYNQTNRTFVFVQENRANNNYRLVHSDAIGENRNDEWYLMVQGNAPSMDQFQPESTDRYLRP
ncbi:GWxTD domain-containing protein [Catalinimonas alkaloidigena]|uniref:GWxTD domain-containing protein n=1 Tax=Catalinimonas alkaloidigena TaxID=1075417 RepID=A0A1G9AKJ5_9BACT|nr:GWxTD domain-containing protein [Catalinimonas alkaloidigena]SDK27889.1 GWxTD domain-containing protein [Catalinimonas alkaloidigena]